MNWNKPKNIWQWLALLSPGAASLAMTAFGKLALSRNDEIVPSILGLPVAFILCVIIAVLLASGADSPGKKIGFSIIFLTALVIVNFAIALGGCAMMEPHLDIK
ncbi:MAG: hypothetical protein PHD76_06810 [Methylacidiphilales bacterium]|nr:hypothetical protein [Candidatus Methylacidiphilales bacterium]